jgi:hypothetical protein
MPSANILKPMRFYTLAGVDEASVRFEPPDLIVGRGWKWLPRHFSPEGVPGIKKLLEEFANCRPDPDAVVRFTKKYGPLRVSVAQYRDFKFRISTWLAAQSQFQKIWTRGRTRRVRFWPVDTLKAKPGESFSVSPWYYEYRTSNLHRLLLLELFSLVQARLKLCRRPDCPTPYFVATHLRQRYCSTACFGWRQRELKRAWWNAKGKQRRIEAAPR